MVNVRTAREWLFCCLLPVCGSLSGCKNEVAAQEAGAAELTTSQQVAATAAQSRFDEGAFSLAMTAPAAVRVGEGAKVVVTLLPKPPFHVNAEYPHRFKVISLEGATTPSMSVACTPAKVTGEKLELDIPVTAGQGGTVKLVGEAAFSVCTAEKCLMEKRQLQATFTAN